MAALIAAPQMRSLLGICQYRAGRRAVGRGSEQRGWGASGTLSDDDGAAKHLDAQRGRPFATLRVTREPCHAERSEASRGPGREALRYAQGDKGGRRGRPFAALRVTRGALRGDKARVVEGDPSLRSG